MSKRHRYLEKSTITEVKRLADSVGVPVEKLLQASLSLSQDLPNLSVEGRGDLSEFGNLDIPLAI